MNVRLFLLSVTLSLFAARAMAQSVLPDTLSHTGTLAQVIEGYNKIRADQSEILNGPQYYLLPQAFKGSPYLFGDPSFQPAIIRYNGTWYKEVPVLYDAYDDLMVSISNNVLYSFRYDKLSDIYLAGHHFIYLNPSVSLNLSPGYYEQLYNGRSEVLVKRSRTVVKRTGAQSVEVLYTNQDDIYIKKDGYYMPVNSKHSVLTLFKDKMKQLKEYLSANPVPFSNDKESFIAKVAAYYDQISH